MANEIQESINRAISTIVDQRIDALELDKTVIGVIDSVVDSTRSIYKIKCDGGYFNARSTESNAIYLPGMSVYIQIPQNDMTKEKLIISRATSLQKDKKINVIISAINNYSILGNSVAISNINEENGLSLRSYHNPREEKIKPETVNHRAQLLYAADNEEKNKYDINLDNFALYRENATALMIEADFRTSLDSVQRRQYGGVYGLGINMVFENSEYQYGETQGEIFDYFSENTKAKEIQDEEEIWHTLKEYDDILQQLIFSPSKDFSDFIKDDGLLDEKIYEIDNLLYTYSENNKSKYVKIQEENNNTYLLMLRELKLLGNYVDVAAAYSAWRDLAIAPPEEKIVSLTLDSNHMTGSPFYFTSWSSQYAIFEIDLTTFKRIDSIIFYKDGFKVDEYMCEKGVDTGKELKPKEDIFMRGLKIYALQPISAVNGDYRLEIQSSDGLILNNVTTEEKLNISAKVTKAYYEDLSNNAAFYWFKKSKNVTTVSSNNYHQYGGIGWEWLNNKGAKKDFITYGSENYAYENHYKCVAVIDSTIVLNQEFIIYNQALNVKINIESDLGTNFSFDAGKPILTCNVLDENKTAKYRYYWAVVVNGQRTFLTGEQIEQSLSSLTSIVASNNLKNLTRGIKFFDGEEEITDITEINRAYKMQFPVVNLLSESSIQFECYVDKIQGELTFDIGSSDLTIYNAADATLGTYKIVIENGEQIFQYDEYGNSPNAKKLKSPQEILPLICHLFNPTGLEIPNSNYSVRWTVPVEETMIVGSNLIDNPVDGLKDLDTNLRCVFDIAQVYNEDCQNNQIVCKVDFNGIVIEKETNFYFGKIGSNGTNGTDMVLRISPTGNHSILNSQPLTLYRFNENSYKFNDEKSFSIIDDKGIEKEIIASSLTGHLKAELFQKNEQVVPDSIVWNIAGNTQTYNNKNGKYLEINDNGQTLLWNQEQNEGLSNYIIRAKAELNNKTYYAFYGLPQIIYYSSTLPKFTRIGINKKTLLKEVVYNADGRNPIYNHNQGVELINVPENYLIEWYIQSGNHNPDFLLLEERNQEDGQNIITIEKNLRKVYILPNDEYAGANNDNLVIANIGIEEQLIATVVVPIHMSLNTFGLASLNAWDGNSVTIDEEEGYIMAPQIGAGEKDPNNRFTGIVMGKTETYTGKAEKEKQIGLLGYAHGLQSIFLDSETGNATFGLPEGQILVQDGNTLVPKEGDNYGEGQIELRPGDVSKIGGWRLGRKSIYYSADSAGKTNDRIGPGYGAPDAEHHLKDLYHEDQGILLSAVPPYISVKGKLLQDSDGLIDDADSQVKAGDALEIQLDPDNIRSLAIYRHYKDDNQKWKRTLISGINLRGQLVSNKIQAIPAPNPGSTEVRTSAGVDFISAFGKKDGYLGASFGASSTEGIDGEDIPFFRAFIDKNNPTNTSATLYITGGQTGSGTNWNDYVRPISIHGNTISLYARDNDNITLNSDLTQKVKILLNNTQFYAGDEQSSHIYLPTSGAANITTIGQNTIKGAGLELKTSGNQNINLRTNNDNDSYSYLKLDADASTSILGATNLYGYARNGNVELYAKNNNTNSSWLTLIKNGTATLRGATSLSLTAANGDATISASGSMNFSGGSTQLYLPIASVNTNALLKAARPLEITSTGAITMTAATGTLTIAASASTANNAMQFNSNIGNFAIQKSSLNKHSIYSSNLGFRGQYGYFEGRYSDATSNRSVYASGSYLTDFGTTSSADGAKGYAFGKECRININSGSNGHVNATGWNVYELLYNIVNQLSSMTHTAYQQAIEALSEAQAVRVIAERADGHVSTLATNYNNHYHKMGLTSYPYVWRGEEAAKGSVSGNATGSVNLPKDGGQVSFNLDVSGSASDIYPKYQVDIQAFNDKHDGTTASTDKDHTVSW